MQRIPKSISISISVFFLFLSVGILGCSGHGDEMNAAAPSEEPVPETADWKAEEAHRSFLESVSLQSELFLERRDSLAWAYGNAVADGDYDAAILTLYEMDSVFQGYVKVMSIRVIIEYMRLFRMKELMEHGDRDAVEKYLYDKNESYIELLMFTQDVFRDYLSTMEERRIR